MKKKGMIIGKMTSIITITCAIVVMSACHSAWAENKGRSIYYKVFTDLVPNDKQEATVRCDSYDDHVILLEGFESSPMTQYDMILGVSALCGETTDGHMEPFVHIDGYEGDVEFLKDVEDGVIDDFKAVVVCREGPDENGDVIGFPPAVPHRIVLECLDHDAITVQKGRELTFFGDAIE